MHQTLPSASPFKKRDISDTLAQLKAFQEAPEACFEQYFADKNLEPIPIQPSDDAVNKGSEVRTEVRSAIETLCNQLDNVNQSFAQNLQHTMQASADTVFRWRPIQRVGIYVPYRYPSTAYTFLSAARAAGVKEIATYLPTSPSGSAFDAASAYVARRYGAEIITGPARYGFPSLAFGVCNRFQPCHLICGPCSAALNEQKQLAAFMAGCNADMSAGPSELVVVADGSADATQVRLDLLSQLEHGPDSHAYLLLVGDNQDIGMRGLSDVERVKISILELSTSAEAVAWINHKGPETVVAYCTAAQEAHYREEIVAAGVLYINASNSLGDYGGIGRGCADPTGGAARSQSGISPLTFMRLMPVVTRVSASAELIHAAEALADYEQFAAHRNAISNLHLP